MDGADNKALPLPPRRTTRTPNTDPWRRRVEEDFVSLTAQLTDLSIAVDRVERAILQPDERAYVVRLVALYPLPFFQAQFELLNRIGVEFDEVKHTVNKMEGTMDHAVRTLEKVSGFQDKEELLRKHIRTENRRKMEVEHHNNALGKEMVMVLIGLIIAVGSIVISNWLGQQHTVTGSAQVWIVGAGLAVGLLVYYVLTIRDRRILNELSRKQDQEEDA